MEQQENVAPSPRNYRQWVVWRYEERDGKQTKVPYCAFDGRKASTSDSSTWSTYEQAVAAAKKDNYDGIGFVFREDDPYCGVDLDGCVDLETGVIADWAASIIDQLDSYAELSPSGTGVHIIVIGNLPAGRRRTGDIEMYDRDRYFTITGRKLSSSSIEERQPEIESVYRRMLGNQEPIKTLHASPAGGEHALTDQEIIASAKAAKNRERFAQLWNGNWRSLGYKSASEADAALCSMIAFWTGPDPLRVDNLFRQSGLYREKWERAGYREGTLRKALQRTDYYRPDDGARLVRAAPTPGAEDAGSGSWGTDEDVLARGEGMSPLAVPFPLEALPPQCRQIVEEGSKSIGCPPDLVAIPVLGVLAAAIGASRTIAIKRSWREGTTLFMGVIAPPGAKKTPAAKLAISPLWRYQSDLKRSHTQKLEKYEQELLEWREQKKLSQGEEADVLPPPRKPKLPRTVVDDTTVEALVATLENNPRGLLVTKDELTGWVRAMDQYKGGRGADRQHWLSLWSASPLVVDRKSREEPIILANPCVSVCGGIQPDMLKELGQDREDGMIERLLFGYPETEINLFSFEEISLDAEQAYEDLYRKLAALDMVEVEGGDYEPGIVYMSSTAKARFGELSDGLLKDVYGLGFPARLQRTYSKLEAYLARLSLIIAMCRVVETGEPERVELSDVEAASKLIDYFKVHARRVHMKLRGNSDEDDLATALRTFLESEEGRWEGSASELHKLLGGTGVSYLPKVADELSKQLLELSTRTSDLHLRRGYRGKGRVLRLKLEPSVGGVGVPNGVSQTGVNP